MAVAELTADIETETAAVLTATAQLVRRYIVLSEFQLAILALWIAHTHAVGAADQTPYIHARSAERRCAKSLLLELLELLTAKNKRTSNISVAALYRFIALIGTPTLLIDEVDAIWSGKDEKHEELRGIINAGNRRGGSVLRCENFTDVREYSVFGPKAFAGIGDLPDTIADRSIPIRMKRKLRSEHVERFRVRKVSAAAKDVPDRLEAWAERSTELLCDAEPELPEQLNDRQQDAVEPLLAIADMAGEHWARYAREALVEILAEDHVGEESLQMRCLRDCRTILLAHGESIIASASLVNALRLLEDGPWATVGGNGLSQSWLAKLLAHYAIRSDQHRFNMTDGSVKQLRGYVVADFADAWNRFLAPAEAVTTVPETPTE